MIRIIYSWKVEPDNLKLFIETWEKTTNQIHREVAGARGSFMLQSKENPQEIKTVARWDSLEAWNTFWQGSTTNHMKIMHELGERISVEVFKEIDDFTK